MTLYVHCKEYGCTHYWNIFIQSLLPPKLAPNQARLVIISESSLKFGKELGAGAFGTVYEVRKS